MPRPKITPQRLVINKTASTLVRTRRIRSPLNRRSRPYGRTSPRPSRSIAPATLDPLRIVVPSATSIDSSSPSTIDRAGDVAERGEASLFARREPYQVVSRSRFNSLLAEARNCVGQPQGAAALRLRADALAALSAAVDERARELGL